MAEQMIGGLREAGGSGADGVRVFVATICLARGRPVTPRPPAAGDPPAVAYVNHGRWVAHCPGPGCAGAELVDLAEPLWYCLSCSNAAADGRWLMVQFPAAEERAAIEALLLARPAAENRNWGPHETVTRLLSENAQRLGQWT